MKPDKGLSDVLVVGAGILGLCTALYLARMGVKVSIVESRCIGAGASGHSGALIRSNCQTETECRLAQRSLGIFHDWASTIGGESGFQSAGVLELADVAGKRSLCSLVEKQKGFGISVELIDTKQVASLSPHLLTGDVAIAAYQAGAGYCEPLQLLRSLFRAACDEGVAFTFGEVVRSLRVSGDRCIGVRTDKGEIAAGKVVLAAGTGVSEILSVHGIDLGLVPHLSMLAVFHAGGDHSAASGPAVLDRIQDAWFRPMPDGGLLVGMGLGGGGSQRRGKELETETRRKQYAAAASRRFDISPWSPCRGLWIGTYVLSPDNLPIIGRHPGLQDVYLAAGDSGGAFKLAPAIGEGLARLIVHNKYEGSGIENLAPGRLIEGAYGRDRSAAL